MGDVDNLVVGFSFHICHVGSMVFLHWALLEQRPVSFGDGLSPFGRCWRRLSAKATRRGFTVGAFLAPLKLPLFIRPFIMAVHVIYAIITLFSFSSQPHTKDNQGLVSVFRMGSWRRYGA